MDHSSDADAVRATAASASLLEICARNLFGSSGVTTFFFKDLAGRFVLVSTACAALIGLTPDQMIGLTDFDITDVDHATELLLDEQRIIATGVPMIDKREADRLADAPDTLVETSKFPLRDDDGTIIGTFGYSRDVTRWALAEQKIARMAQATAEAHAQLMVVEAQLRDVVNSSTDAIAKYDGELRLQYVNPAGVQARGRPLERLIGRTDRETGMSAHSLEVWEPALRRVLGTGDPDNIEFSVRGVIADIEEWFHTTLTPNRDATGAVVGVLSSTRNISEDKRAEQALVRQATHDALTGAANRYLLTERLNLALAEMRRHPDRLTVLFVDLDNFKDVNDQHGHDAGDRVLVETARRLQRATRHHDTVARLGGDEFVVLCDRVPMTDQADEIAGRIVRTLAEPFDLGHVTLQLSASVGAVVAEDPRSSASTILRHADFAMYRAKQNGRNRFEIFDEDDVSR